MPDTPAPNLPPSLRFVRWLPIIFLLVIAAVVLSGNFFASTTFKDITTAIEGSVPDATLPFTPDPAAAKNDPKPQTPKTATIKVHIADAQTLSTTVAASIATAAWIWAGAAFAAVVATITTLIIALAARGVDCRGYLRDGGGVRHHPHLVAHAVVGGDVDRRFLRGFGGEQRIDRRGFAIGDHHRSGLGADGVDLADAVVFLHGSCQFVFADSVGVVGGDRGSRRNAGLLFAAPGQAIDVVRRRGVANEQAVEKSCAAGSRSPWRRPRRHTG